MERQVSRSGSLQPLAPVMMQALRRRGLGRAALLGRIMQRWEDIVGPQIATVAHPEGVRARVLFVAVTDAIWLQQITFYHAQILQQLQQVLGDVPITRVHFTLTTCSCPLVTGAQVTPEPPPLPLTAAEERQVLEGTAAIADAELREAVRRAWRRGWEARRQSA